MVRVVNVVVAASKVLVGVMVMLVVVDSVVGRVMVVVVKEGTGVLVVSVIVEVEISAGTVVVVSL